jgi:hypothetical protein
VMVSIIDLVMIDECSGILTVIIPTQEQLALVSRMFHYITTQVAPKSHTLHLGLVWSGLAGTCFMGRDLFFLLIIMIGHGDVWTGTSSTEVSMLIQFLGSRFGGHRYFILRIPGEEDLYVCRGQISRGQSSAVSTGGLSTEVSMGLRDCRIEQFIDRQGRVDHCRGKLF